MPAQLKLSALALIGAAAVGASSCSTNDVADNTAQDPAENPAPTPKPVVYEQYVALGDSYAAMGSRSAATTGPAACVRSDDNYPNRVADHERVETFTDVSCSSGVTEDIVTPRETAEGPVAPQADALTPSTDLITGQYRWQRLRLSADCVLLPDGHCLGRAFGLRVPVSARGRGR